MKQQDALNHALIRIDALGVDPGEIVKSVSIVIFNTSAVINSRSFHFNVQQSLHDGFRTKVIDDSHIGTPTSSLASNKFVCSEIINFLDTFDVTSLWVGDDFYGLSMLKHYFKQYGVKIPWETSQEKSYSTMEWIFGSIIPQEIKEKPADLLIRATSQVTNLIEMANKIEGFLKT